MPKHDPWLSVVYITMRPGGYDMLGSALGRQTFRDFELICVDDWEPRILSLATESLVKAGVPDVRVVRSKPKGFPELPYGPTNAWNTGFILARGDVVLMCTDLLWLESDFLERLWRHRYKLAANQMVVMPGQFWEKEDARDMDGQLQLWDRWWSGHPTDNGCQSLWMWIPEGFELACTAFPIKLLESINGLPEWTDGYGNQPQESLIEAVLKADGIWIVDRDNFAHFINHRAWKPSDLWHLPKRPDVALVPADTPNPFSLRLRRIAERTVVR